MVMSPHALIPSTTPYGLEIVKLLRRNNAVNALFAYLGEGDLNRAGDMPHDSVDRSEGEAARLGVGPWDRPCASGAKTKNPSRESWGLAMPLAYIRRAITWRTLVLNLERKKTPARLGLGGPARSPSGPGRT
jgi:hypothetical protein